MKLAAILRKIRFGSDVAEEDASLSRYFLPTSVFYEVVEDQADLVLGPKGSGKSAIFRILSDPNTDIPQIADVDIVPAFNTQGSVLFQRLLTEDLGELSEDGLRNAWKGYIVSLIGNHLIETYDDVLDLKVLRETLELVGLSASEGRPRAVWEAILTRIKALSRIKAFEGSLELNEAGMPDLSARVELGGRAEEGTQRSRVAPEDVASWATYSLDFESILELEITALEQLDRRCWIIFDRLDEAFQDSPAFERMALRGLLRAHNDISSLGSRLKSKLFLRTDIFDRITERAGFVNITHLRSIRIAWTSQSVRAMVARRVSDNNAFNKAFPSIAKQADGEAKRKTIVARLLSSRPTGDRSTISGLDWMLQKTTDGTDQLNPRNVLTFLRIARDKQLAICDVTDASVNANTGLLSRQAMDDAWRDLSEVRLWDTLFAEFNSLRHSIEQFRYGQQVMTRNQVASYLGLEVESTEFVERLKELVYCGLLKQAGRDRFLIPDLYRPSLELVGAKGVGVINGSAAGRRQARRLRGGPTQVANTTAADATVATEAGPISQDLYDQYLNNLLGKPVLLDAPPASAGDPGE